MTSLQDPRPVSPTCWTVHVVDPADTGAEGRLRDRLLELLHLGCRRILLDLSSCVILPLGTLHALGELVSWFDTWRDGSPVDIRALAPHENLRQRLRDAGVARHVPVVTHLCEVLQEEAAWCADAGMVREQALFLTYAVSWPRATLRERATLQALVHRLAQGIAPSGGEVEGYDVVDEQAVFYLYGPDCAAMWACVEPVAPRDELPLVGVELRFGGLCAPHVHLLRDARAGRACV